jgi:DinB superfamily
MMTIASYLALIDEAYNRRSWHGTNLRGSIRGLTAKDAAWRPGPGRHNIWELVVHAAYWKYAVWRRLTGAKRGSFALEGSNFFERPVDPGEKAWKADIALLDKMHRDLRAAIAALPPAKLRAKAPGYKGTTAWLISGIAAHDLYHAGQIQLIKKLMTAASRA